jgi:nitrogen-specific signal transduction histidine kinase
VANPRDPSAPRPSSFTPPRPGEFDDSIFEQAARTDADEGADDTDADESGEQPSRREGLPPGFRMRHDSHYVDELMSGGRSARTTTVPAGESAEPRPEDSADAATAAPAARAYAEIGESLEAIGTCLRLFRETARPPAERVALELIETEAARAAWLVQALTVLDEESPVANGSVDLEALARRVVRLLAPGRSGSGATFTIESSAPGLKARGDESLLAMAVAAIATALQAAAERAPDAVVRVQIAEELGGRVRLEGIQNALRMPASWRARFLDPAWLDRPGGRRVAIGLAAASRVAQLHRGTLTMGGAEHGGCRLVLSLPRG